MSSKPQKIYKANITLTLPLDLLKGLDTVSELNNIKRNQLIEQILRQYIRKVFKPTTPNNNP